MNNGIPRVAKEIVALIATFLIYALSLFPQIYSQNLQKKAENNPLDCALLLAKIGDDNTELTSLARTYWKADRRLDAIGITGSLDEGIEKQRLLNLFAEEFLKEGKKNAAIQLWLKQIDSYRKANDIENSWKNEELSDALRNLSKLNVNFHLSEFLLISDDSDAKAFILIPYVEGKVDERMSRELSELIPKILDYGSSSTWLDLQLLIKVRVGVILLKRGKNEQANQLFNEVFEKSQKLKEVENIFKDDLWREVAQGYQDVRQFKKAIKVLDDYRKSGLMNAQAYTDTKLVELYLDNDDRKQAIELMERLLKVDSLYDSIWITETFLKLGLSDRALQIAKNESNMYSQQQDLVLVADYFRKKNLKTRARQTIEFSIARAKTIDASEPEDGRMSDSPAYQQAGYLAKAAEQLINLGDLGAAQNTANLINKPFLRARTLIHLSAKQNRSEALRTLNSASALITRSGDDIFDANKYSVWAELGASYALRGAKQSAIRTFYSILMKYHDIESQGSSSYLVQLLSETGYWYELAGLTPSPAVSQALRKIIKESELQRN